MRKDIYERMKIMKKEDIKPNFAELARRYDCDYRTVKKAYEQTDNQTDRKVRKSKLDDYKQIISDKLELGCSFSSIYHFIKKKGYQGKYSILRDYCRKTKNEYEKKATIRFETTPGLQAQIDWKEEMKLLNRNGEIYTINIFCMVLGYSRMKFWKLTLDRNQDTLIEAIMDGLKYFGGVPKEILFDNMKTVVDHSKSNYHDVVINETFYQFSKDMGFEIVTCRPYRPQTKGKVENLAKFTSRIEPYNKEFDTIDELNDIVNEVNKDINMEVSQATGEVPAERMNKEKEYLLKLPNQDLMSDYLTKPITRTVTKESMITYRNCKYSLDPQYIGKIVNIEIAQDNINIIYKEKIIATHKLSDRKFNYQKDHMIKILKSDAYKFKTDDEIEKIAEKNLKLYDKL